jgi:hypothetical protein
MCGMGTSLTSLAAMAPLVITMTPKAKRLFARSPWDKHQTNTNKNGPCLMTLSHPAAAHEGSRVTEDNVAITSHVPAYTLLILLLVLGN